MLGLVDSHMKLSVDLACYAIYVEVENELDAKGKKNSQNEFSAIDKKLKELTDGR